MGLKKAFFQKFYNPTILVILNQSFITYIKSELLSDVFLCGTIHVSRVRKEISKSRRDAMPFHQMLEINSI